MAKRLAILCVLCAADEPTVAPFTMSLLLDFGIVEMPVDTDAHGDAEAVVAAWASTWGLPALSLIHI